MNFKLESTSGRTVAVLADNGKVRKWVLSQLTLPSNYFIIELLHNIAQIEKKLCEDCGHQELYVYIVPFLERITIESRLPEDAIEVLRIEFPLDAAKLLLFEWGIMLHRWRIDQKQ